MIKIKKTEFQKLYDIACSSWKTKFDDKLKKFLFTEHVEFDESFIQEMRTACDKKQLLVFNKIFKDETTDLLKIKTYKEVCKQLKEKEVTLKDFAFLPKKDQLKVLSFAQLKQIERFFNGTWVPNWKDAAENKYYPYFKSAGHGLAFTESYCFVWHFDVSVAYFKNKIISEHVGKHFLSIYKNL